MTKAAGLLFISPKGNALFLRRTATANDCPSCWDFPGGGQEGTESAEQTAVREAKEEIGFLPDGVRKLHTRTKSSTTTLGVADPGAPAVSFPVSAGAPAASPVAPSLQPQPAMPPDIDFSTFRQYVDEEFTPTLNDEHDGFAWAPIPTPPQPLHPGCRIALERIGMNELDVARAIADGRLTSPQQYENIWLFAIRITGTSASYRPKLDEFVHRSPENYLNEEFLARCNGLPIILRHPDTAILNSEEFQKRIVGTVFLPYIAGDEVWAVTKIYVDGAAQIMQEQDLSTSPGVNFADFTVNARLTLEDGKKVLIEGDPSLIDHVAICELGVWDKGGDPSGIRSEAREDSAMTAEEQAAADKAKKDAAEAEEKAKKDAAEAEEKKAKADAAEKERTDADAGSALDKTLSHIADSVKAMTDAVGNLGKRMDAIEGTGKEKAPPFKADDAEKEKEEKEKAEEKTKADKAKKDADDKEKEKEKAMADSVDITKRIAEVEKAVKEHGSRIVQISDDDHQLLADAWSRADSIFSALGKQTPRAMPGETASGYERRTARLLKEHSPTWQKADVNKAFADDASFGIVRDQIFSEAMQTARNPVNVPAGQLRMIERKQDGHTIREFVGDPRSWMNPMAGPVQLRGEGNWLHANLGKSN